MAGKTFKERLDEVRPHVRFATPEQAKAMIDAGCLVIDVGEAWQLAERGTIPGAINITRGEIDIRADTELPRRDPLLQDRSRQILLTCGGGGKAMLSAHILMEMGFTDVWSLKGGCAGWQAAGYPLVKPG
jgi:rhodanese-related sulfurtransferase